MKSSSTRSQPYLTLSPGVIGDANEHDKGIVHLTSFKLKLNMNFDLAIWRFEGTYDGEKSADIWDQLSAISGIISERDTWVHQRAIM